MGNIIVTEFMKIKRYYVIKAGIIMMSLSVLMSCFYSTANTDTVWDFRYYIQQVVISNCTLFFPIIITLVAVYVISREETDDTLKIILTVPVTYKKLVIGKLWLLFFLTVFFSICNGILAVIFNLFLKFPNMGIFQIVFAMGQIIFSNILIYIAVLPIIMTCAFIGGKSLGGVIFAFVFGYFGTFEGSLLNWFPIKAAMIIAEPNYGDEYGISYNLAPAVISLVAFLILAILILYIGGKNRKPQIRIRVKNKQSTVRRKGWQ